MAAVLLASSAFPTLIAVQKALAATVTVNSQAELVSALANSANDTINIGSSFSTTSEIVINRAVTINGGGFTITPTFSFVSNAGDNSVIEIINTDDVTINSLIIDGTGGTDIHGVNIYNATGVGLHNLTSKNNDKSGIVVNSSTVTVTNVTTSGNGWHGINVDQRISGVPAVLTVNGASNQTDTKHIFVDDTTKDVAVYDTNSQYAMFTEGNARTYMLKPVGTITSPEAGQTVSGTLTLTATYEDWDNGINDDSVQWAVRKDTCTAGAPGVAGNVDGLNSPYVWNGAEFSASIDTSGWADGEYCFVFNPTDDTGYPDVRKTVEFVVDNTPPSKPVLLSPGNGVPVSGNGLVNDWDDVADAHHYTYQSYNVNGSGDCNLNDIRWTEDYLASNTNSRDVADLVFCWRVKAVDELGNESEWSDLWKTVVDNTIPSTPVITNPTDGQYFTSAPILNKWNASTDANGIAKYQIAYHYDDGHTFSGSTCPGLTMPGYSGFIGCRDLTGTQRNHSPNNNEQGGVTIWVRALDNAGHWSNWSLPVHYYYDATPPSVPTGGWPHLATLNSNVFNYTWNPSTDNVSGVTYEYQASQNPAQSGGVLTSGLWQNWVHGNASQYPLNSPLIPSVGTSDGTWYWQVRAVDAAGNKSAWSEIWHYTLDSVAPAVPTAELTQDSDGANVPDGGYTNSQFFTFSLTSSPDTTRYQLKYWNDVSGSPFKELSPWNPTDLSGYSPVLGTYKDNFTQGEGTHYFAFSACDAAGNCSPYSTPFVVTFDKTAPSVAITGFSQTNNLIQPNVDADDANPVSYKWVAVNGPAASATFDDDVLNPVFTVDANTTETYEFELTVTDAAGNSTTVPFSFTYTAPAEETTGGGTVTDVTTTDPNNPGTTVEIPNDGGTPDDEIVQPTLLGTNTEEPAVESANTEKTELIEKAASTSNGKFLGLGWWWLAVLGALAILWLLLFARRTSEDKN